MALARMTTGLLVAGLFLLTLSGCPKDPYEADTWIDKLDDDDPKEVEKAVNKLADEIKSPKAIKPLGEMWRKRAKSSRLLRIIIGLASQPSYRDAEGKEIKGPFWKDAVPYLAEALEFQVGDTRSIEGAIAAAGALGQSRDPSAVQALLTAVNVTHAGKALPVTDQGQYVRIAAMQALGNFGGDQRVVSSLVKVLQSDPLDENNRDNPEAMMMGAKIRAAAANGLGATRNPAALGPLVLALYQVDVIFPQVRGALTQFGEPAIPELMKVFKGEHTEVNKFAKDNNFANDCTKGEGPGTSCIAPGAVAYKSAIVLGDLRARAALPTLIEGLKRPARTSYFGQGGVPGPPDHNGILDALRKIGDPSAADVVHAYMKDPKTDDVFVRPLAIDVYSMVAREPNKAALDYLAGEIKNDGQEVEEIRKSAGMAYARLVKSKDQLAPLDFMIDRYVKKAQDKVKEAEKAKKKEDKEAAEDDIEGYRAFATLFLQHKVRALVGITCGQDPKCYVKYLQLGPDAIVTDLKLQAPPKLTKDDDGTWSKAAKESFQIAAQERSLFEIAKLGPKASEAMPLLLKLADSTERLLREGVLLAMVQVAKKPCQECTQRLDEVIEAQKDQDRLSFLTSDTRVVRNYFAGQSGAK
jgi:HEAT repeat protein